MSVHTNAIMSREQFAKEVDEFYAAMPTTEWHKTMRKKLLDAYSAALLAATSTETMQ